jgi:hypothetical protein
LATIVDNRWQQLAEGARRPVAVIDARHPRVNAVQPSPLRTPPGALQQ